MGISHKAPGLVAQANTTRNDVTVNSLTSYINTSPSTEILLLASLIQFSWLFLSSFTHAEGDEVAVVRCLRMMIAT